MLNKAQYMAARPDGGIVLVIAGAGTGKTHTLVEKIKNILIKGELSAENLLIMTFSRRAAEEIRERVEGSLGQKAKGITAGTFHSYCLGFLRDHEDLFIKQFGFNKFPEVLDEGKSEELLKKLILDSLDEFYGMPVPVIYSFITNLEKIDPQVKAKLISLGLLDRMIALYKQFIQWRKENNLIVFDDMIKFVIELLENNVPLQREVCDKFRYILVDEYQDTSGDNFRLIKAMLPASSPNLFVVGDDWQSIYGFRDSKIEYIVKMKKYFPGAKIHKLIINYRSRKEIVEISNNFIRENRFRTKKTLKSHKGKGGNVFFHAVNNDEQENRKLIKIIKEALDRSEELAILYRNNWQGEIVRRTLNENLLIPDSRVNLMTMHASKGLEFDTVILMGIIDKIIPDSNSELEEERRLFYVALTRAREKLHILCHRNGNGEIAQFAKELGFSAD